MNEFRFILRRICRQKWFIIVALIMTAAQCLLKLWLPLLMAEVVNTGIMENNPELITSLGWKMLCICIFMGLFGYGASLLCAVVGQRFALELREETYKKICSLSVEQVSRFGSGSLITRLTADTDTCSGFVYALILLVAEPLFLMAGGILMMWRISSVLGLVFVSFVLIQLCIMLVFIHSSAPGFMVMRETLDKMNNRLQNAFSNFRLMKAYGTHEKEMSRFSGINNEVFEKSYAVQMKLAIFNPIIMLVMDLAVAVILYISGKQVSTGVLSVGAVLSSITYAEQVLLSITAGGKMFRIIAETRPCAARILQVLNTAPSLIDGNLSVDDQFNELRMENVCFAYEDGTQVFDNLNFRICAGEMVAVIGPLGGGKTTFAGLCTRLFDAKSGHVYLNGKDIRSYKVDEVHRMAALVEKQTSVVEGTVLDNIVFGRENIDEESVLRAVSIAQMEDYLKKNQEGLHTPLLSMGKSLSGGERQRLTIARALAGHPGLLIFDDSTSSLDYETEKNLFDSLREQYPETAIIVTTNRLPTALRADRILLLDNGRISDNGTDKELRERSELYRRICSAQEMRI